MVTTWFKDYSYCLINVVTIELPELSTLVFDRTAFNLTLDAEFSCFHIIIGFRCRSTQVTKPQTRSKCI